MFIKMARKEKIEETKREIEIPEGIEVSVNNNEILARKDNAELRRIFPKVFIEKQDSKIALRLQGTTKREKKQINTIVAHIKNILKGLQGKFVYRLQICSVHFPMNVAVKNKEVIIKNFLGEAKDRKAKILPNTEVKIERDIIIVESNDKEAAGQTAANIEKSAQQTTKDKRVFQDGIFMIERAGKGI